VHRFATRFLIAFRRTTRLSIAIILLRLAASSEAGEGTAQVWVVSNGFHSSFAFRVRDLPFAAQIAGDRHAQFLLIGWGAGDFYRGKVNQWTLLEALLGIDSSLLPVVPVRSGITERFRHSDVVVISLPISKFKILAGEIDHAIARAPMVPELRVGADITLTAVFTLPTNASIFPTCAIHGWL